MKNFNYFNSIFNQLTAMPKRLAMVLTVLFTLGVGQVWAEGTETFEQLANATSYASRSWTGVNGETWSATLARTDQKISGNRGLTFSDANSSKTITMKLTDAQKAAGIGTFTFKYKHPYSDSGKTNTFSISVNGNNYSSGTLNYTSSSTTKTITINAVPNSTSITITITGTARLCVDDFSWTSYVSANPYIVTLKDDNSTLTQSSAGKSVTLPSREGCGGYTFVGWTNSWKAHQTSWITTAPTIIPAGSYTPTADENLYPVYTKTEGGTPVPATLTASYSSHSGWTATNCGGSSYWVLKEDASITSPVISDLSTVTSITFKVRTYGGSSYKTVNVSTSGGTSIGSASASNTTLTLKTINVSNLSGSGSIVFSSSTTSSANGPGINDITINYSTGGSTTYYISVPDCDPCNALQAPNVTATATANSITLSWAAVPGATSYNIYNYTTEETDETTNLTYTFNGLDPNTEYEWEVEAVSATCNGKGKKGTTTTLNACEYLGAATGLTVETDFVQDGQTYVKFSWTPANNTKNYAASQKLCFGKVGEAGTCVDDLANNITWTGGLASKLSAGEYWWSIQALGDGTNYCDGDVVKGSNFTIYSITYNTNGGNTIPATSGTTLPAELPAPTKTGYTFAGWYTDSEFNTPATAGAAITQNTTLYAKWTINQYKVTLNPNYPNDKTGTFTYEAGELVDGSLVLSYDHGTASMTIEELYTSLTLDGYEFGGWYNAKGSNPGQVSGSKCTTTGDITGNKTYFAKWSKLYTITLSENGTTTEPTTQTSTTYKLPAELTAGSCLDDTKDLVGWSKVAIPTPGDKPTSDYYELGATAPLTTDQTTFYAVFATPGEGGDDIPLISFLGGVKSELLAIDGISGSGLGDDYAEGNAPYRVKLDNTGDYILYTNSSGSKITKLYIKVKMIGGENTSKITVQTSDNNSDYKDICVWSIEGNQNTVNYILLPVNSSSKYIRLYFTKGSNVGLGNLIFYTSSTSYSDYTTNCVKLPDPVLSFETEPANPVVFTDAVCGGNSSKQSVTVVGENLRDVVNVSVTGPYKIARTASTALKDFTTSLTLDKTAAGAINANYSTIYIISCPPAQSTDATTGTLTFTTKKGNTLTVNLSTPTVNCTTYALTFNDRGSKTVQNYYAGVEVPQPDAPTGVCTDPIHYVFDGWAEATVANGSTEYTKVTFPYTMPGQNKTLYAVYRYLTSGGNGDYNLVTSALDDWSGDYLIAYNNETFADGTVGGEDGIGKLRNKVDLSSYISNNTIPATEGDKYHVTLEAVTGGYVLKTQDGKYNYHTNNTGNGISASTISFAQKYPINVKFVSQEEINLCLTGDALGSVLRYNTTGYFRFYKNGGQEPVHLYKKASGTTLYTTSPVCGPYVEITSDKDIYVTGGKGVHSTVVAQKKITFSATRLQPNAGGNAPSIKVPAADITIDGNPTTKVALSITQNMEEQGDGTYAGTGEITITYTPTEYNVNEDINVQLRAEYNTGSNVTLDAFTIHARSLPSEFVIVAKSGDKWYALNGDMSNGSSANPANGQITLNDDANPTQATYAPCNTIYTFDGLPNTGDRTRVRFQGTDGAWLWAASGTNVGIQNKTLAQTPTGDNKPYNWKLETEDNITYKFHNDNSSRLLGLSGEKFGMYASGVQEFRILPYVEKCLYNYAPSNLKVSELKSTSVTLTWDAVAGATKYQYRTDGNTWTDGNAEPTVTINGLTGATYYTCYIRAYHADAGVNQECFDYSEVSFTTADCDDVPTDIAYTADLNSITVSWTASASTATVKLYSDEAGATTLQTEIEATSPCKFADLTKNTTYYVQVFAGGTCASPIVPVKTEDVKVDVVEWQPQGIIVDINTDETIGVTLENEVSYGSGLGTEATELFFSKYYEASYNVKLVAIYNGTKNIIDLTDYIIKYGKTSWESSYITLKDFGATKGQIQPGEEIILYSYTENNADDKKILDCVHDAFPDGNWVRVTSSNNTGKGIVAFAGDKTLALFKGENIIDIIGAVNGSIPNNSKANAKPSWGDANGWICATGLSLADDSEIGISTNRCLLVRNNTVTSGANAVANNTTDFVTLCSEWKGAHVLDSDVDNGIQESCENFAYVGTFDYSDYYTKYVSMGDEQIFDENARNDDGTVTVEISDLYKQSCRNIRIKLSNSNGEVLTDREYKVPIMITTTQGTDGEAFLALQENLATVEVDANDQVVATHPLSLDEVREICKTCDVVVRDNATLMKMADDAANDHPQVRDVYVYENSSLIVPNGTNYTINSLSLRRNQDAVASVSTHPDALKLPESAAAPISLDFRLSAENWHWFTLPYDCNISEVTWVDGSPAQYNVDWFLMTYDGEKRAATQAGGCWKAYTGTTIKAGEGFILAINGNINTPAHTYELRFPMSKDVLVAEGTDKTVDVRAWGVKTNIRPNHKGWNLVGNPYLAYYQRNNITNFEGLRLGQLTGPDPQTGYWEQTGDVPYVVVPVGAGWIAYEQVLASETDLLPFTAYFVQVGNDGEHDSSDELSISFDHTKLQLSATPMPASIIQRSASVVEEPVIVGVSLTNAKGESDKTSLIIDDQYTDEYEMNADFFKWFGDYYKYYTKPVLYTIGADQGKRAFNAISEDLAAQPISLGMYAAQAGNYTFSLDLRSDLSKVQEVWLYDATQDTYTNLLQDSYTFQTAKTESAGRFFLSVKMAPKVSTDIDNITNGSIWATTQDHTIIVNGLLSNAQLWIYDATGKLLHTDQTQYYQHSYSVPISGTYFVRVQNTMQTQTIKVVVE